MAVSYRLRFRKDFVIDLVGYRRHGHNENDEPRFTQPTTYEEVAKHPTLREQWAERLIREEVVSQDDVNRYEAATFDALNTAMEAVENSGAGTKRQEPADLGLTPEPMQGEEYYETPVDERSLVKLNQIISTIPDDFKAHPTVARVFARRAEALTESKPGIDWAQAEALAIGSVMQDRVAVRLTGQDCARGTFSQRHAVLWEEGTRSHLLPVARSRRSELFHLQQPVVGGGSRWFRTWIQRVLGIEPLFCGKRSSGIL